MYNDATDVCQRTHIALLNRATTGEAMRIKTFTTAIGTVLAGATLAAVVGGGTASAITPYTDPTTGALGVGLSHSDTVALANSPIPDLVDRIVPANKTGIGLGPGSSLPQANGRLFAPLSAIVGEAAAHPNGYVNVYLLDPNRYHGEVLGVFQHWR